MEEQRNYTLYAHISPSKKIYIGITKAKPERRWNNGNGYKGCPYFWHAIQKYGWENFHHIIILQNLNANEAKELERILIEKYQTNNPKYGYNMTAGGDGTVSREPWNKGKKGIQHHSPETRQHLSEIQKGKTLTEEHRAHLHVPHKRKNKNILTNTI